MKIHPVEYKGDVGLFRRRPSDRTIVLTAGRGAPILCRVAKSGDRSDRFYLIDGSSYFYRAFHAVQPLSTSQGLPTNAIYGFATMLLKIVRDHSPEYLAVAFDLPGPTFREERYPAYKANREEMPADLAAQVPYIRRLVEAFGIPGLERPGFEADDVIATAARAGEARGLRVVIVTGDKDLMQLVSERVTLLDTMKDRTVGRAEVEERFGVPPERVVDILALAGDAIDNIPGVEGVGEKTAAALVRGAGSLDALLAASEEELRARIPEKRVLTARVLKNIREQAETARLSRELATVRTDVPLLLDWDRLRRTPPDAGLLRRLFEELEFGRLLRELTPSRKALSYEGYRLVNDVAGLKSLVDRLRAVRRISVDTETTGLDPIGDRLVGLSIATADGEAYYVPVGHRGEGDAGTADGAGSLFAPPQLPASEVLKALAPFLEDERVAKVGQNLKFDLRVLRGAGIELRGIDCDTMVASYLLDPSRPSHGLANLSREFLDHQIITYEEVTGKGKARISFDHVPLDRARDYSCEDADVAWRLSAILLPKLREEGLFPLFEEIEIPLVGVLADLEHAGVRIDAGRLQELAAAMGTELARLEGEILALGGGGFNIDSPKQLQEILFERLKLPRGRRTRTGWSTDVGVLTRLAGEHPLPRKILDYRALAKLKGTYVDALPRMIHPRTGRIHTSYNQTVTETGRLSSSDPNLQNIPIRTPEGRRIRRAFVPEPGWVLVGADYSQVELRILAHFSEDPTLLEAFHRNEDVHTRTAQELFGESGDEARRRAKAINFGIVYGMSAHGLVQQLDIPYADAQGIIEAYFRRYPGVRSFLDRTLAGARERGWVATLLGRKRYVRDLGSSDNNVRSAAERVAVNTPIQGTAADLIKRAMVRIAARLRREGLRSRMILQVHDELILEAPEDEADRADRILRSEMEGAAELRVPLRAEGARGPDWASME